MFENMKNLFKKNKNQDLIDEHTREDSIVKYINEIIDNWMCDNPTFVVLRTLDKIKEDKSLLEHYFPNIEWTNVDKDYVCNKLFPNNISLEGAKLDSLDTGESINPETFVGQSLEDAKLDSLDTGESINPETFVGQSLEDVEFPHEEKGRSK